MEFQYLPIELQRKIMYSYNIHPVAEIFKQGIQETLDDIKLRRIVNHIEFDDEYVEYVFESSFAFNYFSNQDNPSNEVYRYSSEYNEYKSSEYKSNTEHDKYRVYVI